MSITATTLSVACSETDEQIVVASATGITAPGPNKTNRVCVWIDREQMEVRTVAGTTVTVVRGTNLTTRKPHIAGQKVWIGAESDFAAFTGAGLGLYSAFTRAFQTTLPSVAADTATLTMDKLLGGLILGTPTAAANYTMPTAALLIAALKSFGTPFLGQSFEFTILNTSAGAFAITVVAGTGVTATGTMTIAQNNGKRFLVVVTNVDAPAYTIYSLVGPTVF
jgi:hypothetical protein